LSRRYVGSNGEKTSRETHPPVSLAQVNAAIKEENERLAAAGEPPPPSAPSPRPQAGARAGGADRLEGSIRALVEGNFEQLRGYLEQLQEAVARQGIGGDEIMFGMPGDEDEEDDEDGEGMDEGDDDDEEGGGMAPHGMAALADALGMGAMGGGGGGEPVQIPQVEEAALAELLAMGFPDQLSRNALLLHRNRLQPAVDWALSHVDDPQGNEPLTEDVLAAVYGPQRGGGAGAFMARRRPRLPPGQVDPDTLNSMVEMGFDRDHSARALAVTGNRLEDACQLIINGMPLPPLPEQHPQQGQPAGGAAAGGAAAGGAAAAAAGEGQQGQVAGGGGEEAGEMEHDGDDSHDDSHDEDEDWESDEEDHDAEGEDIDIEHAVDVMFRGLGAGAGAGGGAGGGGHPEEGVNWMSDYASDDDSEDFSDEEDNDEGFHDAGHAMVEEEEGAQPAAAAGAGEAPAAQEPPSGSQPQQPSSGTGGNNDS
jgi:hypothetical protein